MSNKTKEDMILIRQ